MNTKIVYTTKLANYLDSLGFKCIRTELNIKNPAFKVFVFEDTPELRATIESYINKNKK